MYYAFVSVLNIKTATMNRLSKSAIAILFSLSINHSMSAYDSFQQEKQVIQTDSLNNHAGPLTGGTKISSTFVADLKTTDHTDLDRSHTTTNTTFGMDSFYNLNLGFDASTKIFKTKDLKFKFNSIIDENKNGGIQSSFISVDWARPRDTKLRYSFSLAHTGKSYNPTLEFIMRKGNLALNKKLTYCWTTSEPSSVKRHNINISNTAVWNYAGSLIEHSFFMVDWVLETKSTNVFRLGLLSEYNYVGGSFNILRDIEVPNGKYSNIGVALRYEMRNSNLVKTNFELTARDLYNAKGYSFSIDPSWNISQNFSLNTGLNIHHYRFDSYETLRLVLPFVKSSYTLSPKLSIDLFSQYSTETKRIALNSNIKFALKGGHSLDLAYHRNKIDEIANPFFKTPADNSNTFFLKYTYSFAN